MQVRRARGAVAVVFMFLGTAIGLWASRIPDIKRTLGLDDAQFGLLLLVMAVGAVISFPVAGRFIDRLGAAKMTKSLTFATLLAVTCLAFSETVWMMAPVAFVAGWFIGAMDVSMNAWGAEVEVDLGRPIMSSLHGLFSVGAGAGAAAGAGALLLGLSVIEHFVLWALVMAGPLVYVARVPWVSPPHVGGMAKGPLFAIPKGALFLVGVMALVAALGEGAITDWAALYQIQELGFEQSSASIGFSIFSVAMVLMRFAGDRVIARFGAVRVARISGLAAVAGTLCLVVGENIWIVWAGCWIMGIGYAVIFPLAMSRAANDPTMSKGTALAAVTTLGYGAFLLGPPILGFIGEAISLRAAFGIVAVLAVLIVVLASALDVRD